MSTVTSYKFIFYAKCTTPQSQHDSTMAEGQSEFVNVEIYTVAKIDGANNLADPFIKTLPQ